MNTNKTYGHHRNTGSETTRTWLAPGGTKVVAYRDPEHANEWLLAEGPARLVGRHFRHMRDLRQAVKETQSVR